MDNSAKSQSPSPVASGELVTPVRIDNGPGRAFAFAVVDGGNGPRRLENGPGNPSLKHKGSWSLSGRRGADGSVVEQFDERRPWGKWLAWRLWALLPRLTDGRAENRNRPGKLRPARNAPQGFRIRGAHSRTENLVLVFWLDSGSAS